MLIIKELNFGFSQKKILSDINLTIEPGTIHGILGLNGAGKTTLFRTIFGSYRADSGIVSWENQSLKKAQVSFLETENYFYSYITGMEYIQLCTEMKVNDSDIQNWNSLFELPLHQLTDSYSTGMKKKLALLAALLQNRPILILDEPFNGVDMEASERFFIILNKLKLSGKTILLSSHILSSLLHLCDRITHIKNGTIEFTYEKDSFLRLENEIKSRIHNQMESSFEKLGWT
ncbi:MAG: ATP-binding cassette domain-containing protein [Saprospiraceae bacterium]|jgi:ABC-2 type transport system ATP-binding protein